MNYTKINKNELLEWLKTNLDEKRFKHSVGTAECARDLAQKYNIDTNKAYLTGLLHDCAKCFSNEQLLDMMNKYVSPIQGELLNPKTWHAPVGAYIAEHNFGITDNEILSAIRWHTLGKMEMTNFEKIIFLADKVEPKTRSKEYLQTVRKYLREPNGLDDALLVCYRETIRSLVERNLTICPITVEIYNCLQTKLKK